MRCSCFCSSREARASKLEASGRYEAYAEQYYQQRCRRGRTRLDCQLLMKQPRVYGPMMVRMGDAESVLGGVTTHYPDAIRPFIRVLGTTRPDGIVAGMYMLVFKDNVFFFADCTVNVRPDAAQLASIALMTAAHVRALGYEPRVAMLSFSNFGSNNDPRAGKVRRATELVRAQRPSLTVDGEMQVDPAINPAVAKGAFPFSQIQGDANILVFPGLEAANVAYKLLMGVGGAEAIGPILLGMRYPVNVLQRGSSSEEVVNMAAYTAVQAQLQGRLV